MNDKVIIVKGWDDNELGKVVADFIDTYENDGYPAYTIEPHKLAEKTFRLEFPEDIHPLLFTFLVNYVAYLFDLDFSDRSTIVGGKTTLSSLFEGVGPSFVGQKAILYCRRMMRFTPLSTWLLRLELLLQTRSLNWSGDA